MLLPTILAALVDAERALAFSFGTISGGHPGDADVYFRMASYAPECAEFAADPARGGPLGLLRDLQQGHALADAIAVLSSLVRQTALALDDQDLLVAASACRKRTHGQLAWLRTCLEKAAPQALIVG